MIITSDMLPQGQPVAVFNADGPSDLMLVCEHASNFIPTSLQQLGLTDTLAESHIAWDPGALALSKALSDAFAAPLIAATVSRLVYDCNRPPFAPGAIAELSEVHPIPGNVGLSDAAIQSRIAQVYEPFCAAVEQVCDRLAFNATFPLFVTIHSFVPVYKGIPREVEIGVLHDTDALLADCFIEEANHIGGYVVRRNEPYAAVDGVTHTLQARALSRGFPNVMIEVRHDLLSDAAGVAAVADYLQQVILGCLARCKIDNPVGASARFD
jgi:predicted N-formylglutamate amidohydrolase